MNIKNKIICLLSILSISIFTSCDKGGEPEIGGTSTKIYSGDWFIKATNQLGVEVSGYHLYLTYNTADNNNTMWIDDWATRTLPSPGVPSGYKLRSKLTMDLNSGTFSAGSQTNLNNSPNTVIITNGIIVKNGGLSKGNHVVDKITFTGVFSNNPAGTVITFEGHKRTGFYEDEY
jgi:Lipid-binding putative hydrolase